jgi:hypothetical protein
MTGAPREDAGLMTGAPRRRCRSDDRRSKMKTMTGRPLKAILFFLALISLGAEGGVLIYVKSYFPGGFAPVAIYREAPPELSAPLDRDWVGYSQDTLDAVRAEAKKDLGDMEGTPLMMKVTLIRDWARTQTDVEGPGTSSKDPVRILNDMRAGCGDWCEPMAILFSAALDSYGFAPRIVALFAAPGDFNRSHTTVEFWDGTKWILEDPTFVSVAEGPDGHLLNAETIQESYNSGSPVRWVQDGLPIPPDVNGYKERPDQLYRIVVWRLHGIGGNESRISRLVHAFRDRLIGNMDSILVTRETFPVPIWVADGTVDRELAVVFILSIAGLVSLMGSKKVAKKSGSKSGIY